MAVLTARRALELKVCRRANRQRDEHCVYPCDTHGSWQPPALHLVDRLHVAVHAKAVLFKRCARPQHLSRIGRADSERAVIVAEEFLEGPRPLERLAVEGRMVAVDDGESGCQQRGYASHQTRLGLHGDRKDHTPGAYPDRAQLPAGGYETR